jgi:hypothetical protein
MITVENYYTKYINTLWGENLEFSMLKYAVHTVTALLQWVDTTFYGCDTVDDNGGTGYICVERLNWIHLSRGMNGHGVLTWTNFISGFLLVRPCISSFSLQQSYSGSRFQYPVARLDFDRCQDNITRNVFTEQVQVGVAATLKTRTFVRCSVRVPVRPTAILTQAFRIHRTSMQMMDTVHRLDHDPLRYLTYLYSTHRPNKFRREEASVA